MFKIVSIVGLDSSTCLTQAQFDMIFTHCKDVLGDYTMDKRGDIGSIVREAAMGVILNILKKWVASRREPVEE